MMINELVDAQHRTFCRFSHTFTFLPSPSSNPREAEGVLVIDPLSNIQTLCDRKSGVFPVLGNKFVRRHITQRLMWSVLVVVDSPGLDLLLRIVK